MHFLFKFPDGFQTDTQISSKNNGEGGVGGGPHFRELKEFEFDDTFSMNDEGLDGSFSIEKDRALEDGSNGWSAADMFSMNEKKYGVQTSYKENLEGYTVQLKQSEKSSDEYRYLKHNLKLYNMKNTASFIQMKALF